jgi:4'-phosphopantetheinyl transferase EntD
MSNAGPLNELFSKALRDLPAGLYFAVEASPHSDHSSVRAAARLAARRALKDAGYEGVAALTANEHGAPDWPAGWVGSISHSKGICIAVVARQNQFPVLGVDLEHLGRMRRHTVSRIATDAELAGIPESDMLLQGTVLFSLKEAFYKAQHPQFKSSPRFHDLQLKWSSEQTRASILGLSGVVEKELQLFCQRIILHAWTDTNRVLSIVYASVQ